MSHVVNCMRELRATTHGCFKKKGFSFYFICGNDFGRKLTNLRICMCTKAGQIQAEMLPALWDSYWSAKTIESLPPKEQANQPSTQYYNRMAWLTKKDTVLH